MNMQEPRDLKIEEFFRACLELKAAAFRLKTGERPEFEIDGTIQPLDIPPFSDEKWMDCCLPMLDSTQQHAFLNDGKVTFSFVVEFKTTQCRFRVSMLARDDGKSMTARKRLVIKRR